MPSKIIRLGTDANPNMSSAVVHQGVLTTMGVIDPTPDASLDQQISAILATIDALFKEGNTNKTQLLTANIWLKDIARDFAAFNALWVQWIDADNKPVRACVQAEMARPHVLVEIQVTAAVD